jgi:DNA-directed RNA polymerase III subunit RPC6
MATHPPPELAGDPSPSPAKKARLLPSFPKDITPGSAGPSAAAVASGSSGGGPSAGASAAKRKSQTAAAVTAAAKQIRQVAQMRAARGLQLRMADLETEMAATPLEVRLAALQQLMGVGALAASGTLNGQPVFKLQSEEEAAKLRELTAEDRLVLQEVEKAGVSAISTKELRYRAGGLPQQSLTKILKRLEARQLVKPVKSVNSGNVKKYMLHGLTPSKEVTGGPWYCDGEFDYEFIANMQKVAMGYVQQRQQATALEVYGFIRDSGLLKSTDMLRPADVDAVLQALVYDAKLEMTAPTIYGDERRFQATPKLASIEDFARSLVSVPKCECLTCRGLEAPGGCYVPCPNLSRWLDRAVGVATASRSS